MTRGFIKYWSGYKYQLASDYQIRLTTIFPAEDIETDFINLDKLGVLLIKSGYAWDGPSGPVIDTKNNLRAALVHDALYQLMRWDKLDRLTYRDKADRIFQQLCKDDGVSRFRAFIYYRALKRFGKRAAKPKSKKTIRTAP